MVEKNIKMASCNPNPKTHTLSFKEKSGIASSSEKSLFLMATNSQQHLPLKVIVPMPCHKENEVVQGFVLTQPIAKMKLSPKMISEYLGDKKFSQPGIKLDFHISHVAQEVSEGQLDEAMDALMDSVEDLDFSQNQNSEKNNEDLEENLPNSGALNLEFLEQIIAQKTNENGMQVFQHNLLRPQKNSGRTKSAPRADLNRPESNTEAQDLKITSKNSNEYKEMEIKPYVVNIFWGGVDRLQDSWFLHTHDYQKELTKSLGEDLCVTPAQEMMEDIFYQKGPKSYVLMVGCMEWKKNQLEKEIKEGKWIVLSKAELEMFKQDASEIDLLSESDEMTEGCA